MMKILLVVGAIILLAGVYELTKSSRNNVDSDFPYVKNLDIDKFMGRWYVIAAKPNLIEKNCHCARTLDTRIDATTI